MKLVDDAKDFLKWNSTHVVFIASLAPGAWASLPADLKAHIPDGWMPWIAGAVLFGAFSAARLRKQKQ